LKLLEQTPDLGRCWVRYAFRSWPGSGDLWLDLFSRALGRASEQTFDPGSLVGVAELEDVVYLPPVESLQEEFREQVARRLTSTGTPVLVQSLVGTALRSPDSSEIIDVLHTVATGDVAQLDTIPAGATVIWPLISGYSDGAELWDQGLGRLAAAGVTCVQGVAADLSPADRRRIVEVAGEHGFERLFHGPAPTEREFAVAVRNAGMEPFFRRPLPSAPSRLVHNRRLAGYLASIGELWLRLDWTESRGQSFYRAARWVDRESHDLVVLAREGNLGVVSWLDDDSCQVIEEIATRGESSLLQELEGEYLDSGESQ